MKTKEKWTYEEEQELIDLRYENVPLEEVAKLIGRSVDSCRKKHWKLMQEAYTPKWYQKIQEYEQGYK